MSQLSATGSAPQPVGGEWTKGVVGLGLRSPGSGSGSCFQRWVGAAARPAWMLGGSLHLHTSASSSGVSASLGLPIRSRWKGRSSQLVPAAPQSYSARCTAKLAAAQQGVFCFCPIRQQNFSFFLSPSKLCCIFCYRNRSNL